MEKIKPRHSYVDIGRYFGKTNRWLTQKEYLPHKQKIISMYGEISIPSLVKYFDYQDNLLDNIKDINSLGILSKKEIAEVLDTSVPYAHSIINSAYNVREEYTFVSLTLMSKLEAIVSATRSKIKEIIELEDRLVEETNMEYKREL